MPEQSLFRTVRSARSFHSFFVLMVEPQKSAHRALTLQPFRVSNTVPPEEQKTAAGRENTVRQDRRKGAEMETYIKTMENRKELVKRLEQLTGERAVYTRMPECAFIIGNFKVERYGNLVILDEEQDGDAQSAEEIISTLLDEGMIRPVRDEEEDAAETENDEETAEKPEPETISISLPLEGHTAGSIRNLIAMIRARGNLISKATGGQFFCTKELAEALAPATDIPAIRSILKENSGALEGLVIEEDRITFAGFPLTQNSDTTKAFMQLASLMVQMAKEQKHTLARPVETENEKYSFRIWLISLGMKGDEYKTSRHILLGPLFGNAAFKDEAMQKRWKEKQRAKRAGSTAEEGLRNAEEGDAPIEEESADSAEPNVKDEVVAE